MDLEERVIEQWLDQAGFSEWRIEIEKDLLILKLSPLDRTRLLQDSSLRGALVALARGSGFSRVALEL